MKFVGVFRSPETNIPPTPDQIAAMGKLTIEWTRGFLAVAGDGESEVRQLFEE